VRRLFFDVPHFPPAVIEARATMTSTLTVPARESTYPRHLLTRRHALSREKPVWTLAEAHDAILELARGNAAISQGQLLVSTGAGLKPLPWQPGSTRDDRVLTDHAGPSVWKCITSLQKLETLRINKGSFPLAQFAELAVALPRTDGPHRSPFTTVDEWTMSPRRCKACDTPKDITLGKPRRELCRVCNRKLVERHVARWEILVSAAMARRSVS
jgi:hypothetical protein